MGDEIYHIQAGDTFCIEKIFSVRVLFQEDGSQYITDGYFRFFGGTGMIHRPLNDALKTNGLLQHIFIAIGNLFNFSLKKVFKGDDQIFDIAPAIFNDVNADRVIQDGKKNVLDTDIFVAPFFSLSNSKSKSCTEFFADHNLLSFHNAF